MRYPGMRKNQTRPLTSSLILSLALVMLTSFSTPVSSAQAQDDLCSAAFQSVAIPLTELSDQTYTRMDGQETDFSGGLYPNGSNQRPAAHEAAGVRLAESIQPLDADGNPDPINGRIIMISIGMSNTSSEFDTFRQLAAEQPQINPNLVLVNGALSGQTADKWTDPQALAWQELANRLEQYQLSPQQVQVAWIKQTLTRGGDFPDKALELKEDLGSIVRNLKAAYPNVKIAYLSSRIYSYTYWRGLSPEPNAYETGFAVKWLIEDQIKGDPSLNFDPQPGEVVAPYLSWSPYLWANGEIPREDGLRWLPGDLTNDCTHPGQSGRQKVADLLWQFFSTDSTSTPWFLIGPADPTPTFLPLITASVTPSPTRVITATINPSKTTELEMKGTLQPEESDMPAPQQPERFGIWAWLRSLFAGLFSKQ